MSKRRRASKIFSREAILARLAAKVNVRDEFKQHSQVPKIYVWRNSLAIQNEINEQPRKPGSLYLCGLLSSIMRGL